MKNVMDYGAKGDGSSDDREAIQRAIDDSSKGSETGFPAGFRFLVGAHPQHPDRCLCLGPEDRLVGPGTIAQAKNLPRACRVIHAEGPDISLRNITIAGDGSGVYDGQRHGVFATAASSLVMRCVTISHCSGDGLYIYNVSDGAMIEGCHISSNARHGITIGGGNLTQTRIQRSVIAYNADRQIGAEPSAPYDFAHDVLIESCELIGNAKSEYALTIAGSSSASLTRKWRVMDCSIEGGILVRWAHDVLLFNNEIVGYGSQVPALHIDRSCIVVKAVDNSIQTDHKDTVWISATSRLNRPCGVILSDNSIRSGIAEGIGVRVTGASEVELRNNNINGIGNDAVGVYVRSVFDDTPIERITLTGNSISGFGTALVARGTDSLKARIKRLYMVDNIVNCQHDYTIDAGGLVEYMAFAPETDREVPIDPGEHPWGWQGNPG